jgi:exopolysaccharide production protein ExoZ
MIHSGRQPSGRALLRSAIGGCGPCYGRAVGKLRSLQVLRFFAALAVVWEHAMAYTGHPFSGGQIGVDVFFVLSGFVISHAARTRPETFLRDRLTRIYPTYWLWAAGWLALAAVEWPLEGWPLFTTLTLLPAPTASPATSYVGVGWTLSFEMLFYFAVWLALRGVPWRALALAYIAAFTASIFTRMGMLKFLGSPMVIEFVLGMLAYRLGRGRPTLGAFALVVAAVLFSIIPKEVIAAQAWMETYVGLGRIAFAGPVALMVVWGAAQFDCASRLWRPLALLGDASYSIYLSHLLLMRGAAKITGRYYDPVFATVACVAIGLAAYLGVERPLLAFVHQRRAKSRAEPLRPQVQQS